MKFLPGLLMIAFVLCSCKTDEKIEVKSPDGKITFQLNPGTDLSYDLYFEGQKILENSPLGFELSNEPPLGDDMMVVNAVSGSYINAWVPRRRLCRLSGT